MNRMIRFSYSQVLASLFCLMLVFGAGSFAYGYHFFEADNGGCKWASFGPGNVDFLVDGSSTTPIGDSLLAEATAARDAWNDISTAKNVLGNFTKAGVDYIDTNFGSAWGIGVTSGSGAADGQFEVVLDETGDILTNVFSLDPANINGFGPSRRTVSGGACTITDAFNLLNGTRSNFDRPSTTFHEFGHIQGLAHSSVGEFNSRNNTAFSGGFASPSAALDPINISNVPTMHPFSGGTGSNRSTPEQDDKAGLSELYPETSFTTTLGGISGTVTKCSDDTALEGVNVRAVSTTSSSLQVTRYSAFDSNGTGKYVINGLPPGDYKVIIEPMGFNGFTAGRMAIKTRIDSEFPTEYYGPTADEENNCTEDIPDTPLNISVVAGATTPNINFKVGGVKLAFVVDDTGSMGSEITAVRDILNLFVTTLEGLAATVPEITFPDTAIVTFKDDVTLRIVSNDPDKLRTVISALSAVGGGDCPESSNAALMEAGKLLVREGVAILFTDADSRSDGPSRAAVSNFYRSKSLVFSVLLSSTCSGSFGDLTGEKDLNTFQGDGGPIRQIVSIADEFPEESMLGTEDAVSTFSSISSETGGIFKAVPRPGSGDDEETSYINTGANISVSSVVPAVASVAPGSGPVGATFNVVIEGANTNWSQASSTVAFAGFTEVVNSFTVNSPTSITANITIPGGAPTMFVDVTVTTTLSSAEPEIANGVGAFQLTTPSGFADIVSIAPAKGSLGATLDVEITGIDNNFVNGTTTVSFLLAFVEDTKITVNTVTVNSPTTLSVNITVANDADVGFRNVKITTDTEETTENNGFLVTSTPLAIARVINLVPASGKRGAANLDVVITGENTNFVDGISVASFSGTGITVVSTTVTSPTQATARITILSSAALGFRNILVSTGDETAVILNGFLVKISGTINITANELNGPITLGPADTLSVKIDTAVGASAGIPADWWVALNTPFDPPNDWFHFDLNSGWIPGLSFMYQGPLFDLTPPVEVFSFPASGIPSGTYTFYFAVDTVVNGVLDVDKIIFDFVKVIKP